MSAPITVNLTLSNVPNAARVPLLVAADESPASFREKASEATKIPLDSMRLIFRGRLVGKETDKKVIEEFKLEQDSVIHCMGKPVEAAVAPVPSTTTTATGSSVTVTAGTAPATTTTSAALTTLTSALVTLRTSNASAVYLTAVATLEKVLANIANNPMEEKYRKVKRGNAAFNKRLGGLPGGEACMIAVGFSIDTGDGDGGSYMMHPSPEAWPKLVQDRAELARAVQSATNATAVAPPMGMPPLAGGMPAMGGAGLGGMPGMGGMPAMGGMPQMTPQMQQAAAQMMQNPQQMQAMLQVRAFYAFTMACSCCSHRVSHSLLVLYILRRTPWCRICFAATHVLPTTQ